MAREHNFTRDIAANLHNLAACQVFIGEVPEAMKHFEEAEKVSRRYHLPVPLQVTLTGKCWATFLQGDYALAEPMVREGLEISREVGAPRFIGQHSSDLARGESQSFIGPKIMGIYARTIEDLAEQDDILAEAEEMLMSPSVSHNAFFYIVMPWLSCWRETIGTES